MCQWQRIRSHKQLSQQLRLSVTNSEWRSGTKPYYVCCLYRLRRKTIICVFMQYDDLATWKVQYSSWKDTILSRAVIFSHWFNSTPILSLRMFIKDYPNSWMLFLNHILLSGFNWASRSIVLKNSISIQIYIFFSIFASDIKKGGMPHQLFILQIISVSHLTHVITINNMVLALIDFIWIVLLFFRRKLIDWMEGVSYIIKHLNNN